VAWQTSQRGLGDIDLLQTQRERAACSFVLAVLIRYNDASAVLTDMCPRLQPETVARQAWRRGQAPPIAIQPGLGRGKIGGGVRCHRLESKVVACRTSEAADSEAVVESGVDVDWSRGQGGVDWSQGQGLFRLQSVCQTLFLEVQLGWE
jgi:hypothetical protein